MVGIGGSNLDEYFDIADVNHQCYRSFMQKHLFDHVDINLAHTFLPT